MVSYKIKFSNSFEKDFEGFQKAIVKRIWLKIDSFEIDPYENSIKLSGSEFYRIRVGDYRVIYEICEKTKTVTVLKVKHRKDVYKKRK